MMQVTALPMTDTVTRTSLIAPIVFVLHFVEESPCRLVQLACFAVHGYLIVFRGDRLF
jgi:hypothetical protein